MGPQLYRCGNSRACRTLPHRRRCFNGAATLSLRKLESLGYAKADGGTLQWGRNFIVAETHGAGRRSAHQSSRFNGAATLSLRKRPVGVQEMADGLAASMGPQLYRCGNTAPRSMIWLRIRALQWGRNFIVAETKRAPLCQTTYHLLQWGRNFIVAETGILGELGGLVHQLQWGRNFIVAETPQYAAYSTEVTLLQWGRNFIVAETPDLTLQSPLFEKLQWGRNFIVAETRAGAAVGRGPAPASMGPQLYRCGNTVHSSPGSTAGMLLQWGRNFIVAETSTNHKGNWIVGEMLQWGRNFIVAETAPWGR